MRKFVIALITGVALILGVSASAFAGQSASGNVRIGGVGYSSLGTGVVDLTPGVESVILLNYGFQAKNLKGYTLTDKAGNSVRLCRLETVAPVPPAVDPTRLLHDCNSTTADSDSDGVVNLNDKDSWLTLSARSQTLANVEILHDGAFLNNGGDTLYLRNSVGTVVSTFVYKVV